MPSASVTFWKKKRHSESILFTLRGITREQFDAELSDMYRTWRFYGKYCYVDK
jgi:hypothetical protein